MSIKLVVFDMAGTTVADDGAVQQHLFDSLQHVGVHAEMSDVNDLMGYPKPLAISMLLSKYMDEDIPLTHALTRDTHEYFLQTLDLHYANTTHLEPKKGTEEVFTQLRAHGIKVALDTGFGRSTADVIVDRLGWLEEGLIDLLITSDDVERGRPEPDMIYLAMKKLSIFDVDQVMKVGDTKSDMLQGKNAGCRYIVGVTTGAYSREDLMVFPHTNLIEDLSEILDILEISNGNGLHHQ